MHSLNTYPLSRAQTWRLQKMSVISNRYKQPLSRVCGYLPQYPAQERMKFSTAKAYCSGVGFCFFNQFVNGVLENACFAPPAACRGKSENVREQNSEMSDKLVLPFECWQWFRFSWLPRWILHQPRWQCSHKLTCASPSHYVSIFYPSSPEGGDPYYMRNGLFHTYHHLQGYDILPQIVSYRIIVLQRFVKIARKWVTCFKDNLDGFIISGIFVLKRKKKRHCKGVLDDGREIVNIDYFRKNFFLREGWGSRCTMALQAAGSNSLATSL